MKNNETIIILIILGSALLSRFNIERHKKNYRKTIENLKENSNSNNIEILMNYLNKSFKIQEDSQLNYTLIIILILGVITYM